MKRMSVLGCLPTLFVLSASAAVPSQTTAAGVALIASARAAIDAANNEWLPAMRAHDARKVAAPYAVGALFVLANGDSVRGRSAIQKMYQDRFGKPGKIVSGQLVEDGLTAAGNLIYEWGHARVVLDRGGKSVVSAGNYLTVWQRDPHGQWQIIRNLVF